MLMHAWLWWSGVTQLQQLQRAVGPTGSDCSSSVQQGRPLLFFCTCCTWWSRRWLPDEPYQNVVWQSNRPLQAPLHALRSLKRFVRPLPALPACSQFRISQKLPTLRRVVQKSPSVVIPCLANLMATLPASGQSDPTHIPFTTAVTIVDIKDDVAVLRSLQHPKKVSCTHCSGCALAAQVSVASSTLWRPVLSYLPPLCLQQLHVSLQLHLKSEGTLHGGCSDEPARLSCMQARAACPFSQRVPAMCS